MADEQKQSLNSAATGNENSSPDNSSGAENAAKKEPAAKPFYSVLVLAFVCSALVAGAAVGLRPKQEANRLLDRKKNILIAAGLYREKEPIDKLFGPIEARLIDLATGEFVDREDLDPKTYNQVKAALMKDDGRPLAREDDIARLGRLEKYGVVYLVKQGDRVTQYVLPVRGKGLWSTMYAYVALDADLSTIRGVSFYEHGETPGLGGEIENKKWQSGWRGKKVYDSSGQPGLKIVKGRAAGSGDEKVYQIDGLSGATLTAKGVNNLMEFWFGDHGYKPFFKNIKTQMKG
ncbi:Na(+)-translocating NADH-quinone reductase subunit C [Desulfomarina sp.]